MRACLKALFLTVVSASTASAKRRGGREPQAEKYFVAPGRRAGCKLRSAVRVGNLLFLSGSGRISHAAGKSRQGPHARTRAIKRSFRRPNLLATARANLGSLDKVKRVVKVLGMG